MRKYMRQIGDTFNGVRKLLRTKAGRDKESGSPASLSDR